MSKRTRLPSSLTPTTRECVHLVRRGHFRSRDKDCGHTVRSAITENPMLHANVMVLCFIGPELLPIEVLHCGNRDLRPFCSCDLDLDLMTFIYEHEPYLMKIHQICKNELQKGFRKYVLQA